jgi:AraC-like DNA-binding protein
VSRSDPNNVSRYWLDPGLRGLSLLAADFRTHEYVTHTHDALLVAVTESGGAEIKAGGVPDEVDSVALLVVNPDEPHSSRMLRSRRWRYRSLYLDLEALALVGEALGVPSVPSFDENVFHEPDLIQDFLQLHHGLDGGKEDDPPRPDPPPPGGRELWDPLEERELLVAAFGRLVRRHGRQRRRVPLPPRDQRLLDRVLRLIRERHAEQLRLEDLADPLGLTQYQLIKLVRTGIGMTPHAYLTQIRLDAARELLHGRLPIAEVALMAGFYDQPALTNHFKRALGITPLQYVRAVGGS